MPMLRSSIAAVALLLGTLAGGCASAQEPPAWTQTPSRLEGPVQAVELHPFAAAYFVCAEHPAGELATLSNDLGRDCFILNSVEIAEGRRVTRTYRTNGLTNEDYFSWGRTVLAPFDGVVEEIHDSEVVNTPGMFGSGVPGYILFRRADGMRVVYAHTDEPRVAVGDHVTAGQDVAKIGNNGQSSAPHIHIGAWLGDVPYQIRFDLRALRELQLAAQRRAQELQRTN